MEIWTLIFDHAVINIRLLCVDAGILVMLGLKVRDWLVQAKSAADVGYASIRSWYYIVVFLALRAVILMGSGIDGHDDGFQESGARGGR